MFLPLGVHGLPWVPRMRQSVALHLPGECLGCHALRAYWSQVFRAGLLGFLGCIPSRNLKSLDVLRALYGPYVPLAPLPTILMI